MSNDVEAIFDAARKLSTPAARKAFLDAACAENPEWRRQIEELLEALGSADQLFEPGAAAMRNVVPMELAGPELGSSPTPDVKPGERIGRYKLLEKIGEGGMGFVYMAEQREPIVRKVALKIIKAGMDTRQVVARFEAERQALALMDHRNIAKVFDGGSTETGRPYFVMDLVPGLPITQFCDEAKLSTRERLELFLEVCSAIQHAHQKGIIHRDIKPSNILVTLHGEKPVPKVIDFGIAKTTQGRLTDKTLFTQFQHFIGTPAYMSPEQASLSGLDIDTRSDIYGLGVLLYELLTGATPFDAKELLQSGLDEMRRTIREQEPPRPSTRLRALSKDDLTTTAGRRGTDAPRLISALGGFSNGAHTTAVLLAGQDEFILQHFRSFYFIEGGFGPLAANFLGSRTMKPYRFLLLRGDRMPQEPRNVARFHALEHLGQALEYTAQEQELDFKLVVMRGLGHELRQPYDALIGSWLRGEKWPDNGNSKP